jgi:hypothetical protein
MSTSLAISPSSSIMPNNWGICWLEQLLYCLTNCVGWEEDILARDYRVEVETEVGVTEVGVAEPSTELMNAVCWDTCLCVRNVLERVDNTLSVMVTEFWQQNKFVTSETVPHHPNCWMVSVTNTRCSKKELTDTLRFLTSEVVKEATKLAPSSTDIILVTLEWR